MTFHVIRSCKTCEVDVSVSQDEDDPRCPRCGGELGWPTNPQGDASDKTLLEGRPADDDSDVGPTGTVKQDTTSDSAMAETIRESPPSASGGSHRSATGAAATRPGPAESDEHSGLAETATFPGGNLVSVGRRLGAYELRRVLGKGGMGVVYEAFHTDLERVVALKVMSGNDIGEEEYLRFKREARAAAKLQHHNIVPILEVGEADGQHYFTMELVRGRTLQALARSGDLTPGESARIVAKVARAIDYAHQRKIIHRDLKPSNVLIDEQGEPHVMDFGLAKDLADVSGLTLTGVAMGSPPYMPPEQARGEFKEVDEISDVYGLGATLYECLAGKPPFGGKSLYDVIAKVLVEDPPAPRTVNPEVGYDLETVCLKALEKEKWRRYPNAASMAEDLERTVQGLSIRAVRQGLTTRVARMIRRHQSQLFLLLIPLVVCGSILAYMIGGSKPPPAIESTGSHRYEVRAGPLRRAVEHLENNEDAALHAVFDARPTRLPSWTTVAKSLKVYRQHRKIHRALESERDAAFAKGKTEADPVEPGRLASIVSELIRDPKVDHATLGTLVMGWLEETPKLAELTRRTVLAVRGTWSREPEPFKAVFAGDRSLTILDRAILIGAAQVLYGADSLEKAQTELTPPSSSQRSLSLRLGTPPRLLPLEQAVVAEDANPPWVFPEVRAPGVKPLQARLRPLLRGLVRPSAKHSLLPTTPLRTAKGDHVVVAWLRFVYLLRESDGGVVSRARLPGLAEALEYEPDGGYRVRVWTAGVSTWVTVRRGDAQLSVRSASGEPIPLPRYLAWSEDALPDQLEREARSLFPEFEEVMEFTRIEKDAKGLWQQALTRIDRTPPLTVDERIFLGFRQADADRTPRCPNGQLWERPLVPDVVDPKEKELRRITWVDPTSPVLKRVQVGDLLHRWEPSRRLSIKRYYGNLVSLREVEGRTVRRVTQYSPFRKLKPADLDRVIDATAAHLARHADPNPWVRAIRAAALTLYLRAKPDGAEAVVRARDGEALRAVRSKHLVPRERVAMGCFLDRYGLDRPADEAFQRALSSLTRTGAFLPSWAGYGPLDCGRQIADRVDQCLTQKPLRPERSRTLARWRNMFAPSLNESQFAADSYRRRGFDLAQVKMPDTPPLPPPWPARAKLPPKGVGGMTALSLTRIDQVLVVEKFFGLSLLVLLGLTVIRCRRHGVRDLDRVGAVGAYRRLEMWWKRPGVRLRYAWFTYLNIQDRLAFLILLGIYFFLFAIQDAWLEVVVAQRNARASLLAGNPGEEASLSSLEGAYERDPTASLAYIVCWLRAARGLEPHPAAFAALKAQRAPRARLLLAEIQLRGGDRDAARATLTSVGGETRLELRRAAIGGRLDQPTAPIPDLLAATSVRLTLARWAKQHDALLSPAPSPRERDIVLLGKDDWTDSIPYLMARTFFQPFPGSFDASISAFHRHTSWRIMFVRYQNSIFWVVPLTFLLLILSVVVFPGVHEHEPLSSDLARPGPLKRIARLVFPGVPQYVMGKPIRGTMLLLCFVLLAHAVFNLRAGFQASQYHASSLRVALFPIEQANLTGEVVSAFPAVRARHFVSLAWLLLLVYTLHWIDLALTQRKQMTSDRRGPHTAPDPESRYIIPLDSASGMPSPPDSPRDGAPGPFDATERDI